MVYYLCKNFETFTIFILFISFRPLTVLHSTRPETKVIDRQGKLFVLRPLRLCVLCSQTFRVPTQRETHVHNRLIDRSFIIHTMGLLQRTVRLEKRKGYLRPLLRQ